MKKGFVFIETIIVVCILTVSLISLYANYSKIIANTKELNIFDTAEYNYKTYFLKQQYNAGTLTGYTLSGNSIISITSSSTKNTCYVVNSPFSEKKIKTTSLNNQVKVCLLLDVSATNYVKNNKTNFDAYIIDYLNTQDFHTNNDDIFLVEYKKADKQNGEYFTYISSLNY